MITQSDLEGLGFCRTPAGGTRAVEDILDGRFIAESECALVEVRPGALQTLGQRSSDGRLSRTTQADQYHDPRGMGVNATLVGGVFSHVLKSLQRTFSERPIRRLRLIIFRPALVFIRARNPCLRIFLILLTRLG